MAGLCIGETTTTSIEVYLLLDKTWTDADGIRIAYWYRGSAGGGIPTTASASAVSPPITLANGVEYSGYYTFDGLEPNKQYGFYCAIYQGTQLLGTATGYAKTDISGSSGGGDGDTEQTWSLTKGDLGSVSVDSSAWLMDLKFSSYYMHRYAVKFTEDGKGTVGVINPGRDDVCCYVSTGMTYDPSSGIPNLSVAEIESSSSIITLTFDTQAYLPYYIWIREANGNNSTSTFSLAVSLQTLPTIAKWDWYSSNGDNASASQTISAYTALNGTGIGRNTKNFPHEVWNDMVDKVKAILGEVGGYWDADYATYDGTMSIANENGEYVLTAVMFNSLRNNLEIAGFYDEYCVLGYKTGIGQVFSGDTVYGDYFLTLAEYMNDCIDNLP